MMETKMKLEARSAHLRGMTHRWEVEMYSGGGRRKTEGLLLRALDSRAEKILAVYDRKDESTLLTGGTAFEWGSG